MEKRTVLDQIECTASRFIQIRLRKEIVNEQGKVEATRYHRTAIAPGVPLSEQVAILNADLVNNYGYPALAAADVARIQAIVDVEHTPEVVAEFHQKMADAGSGGIPQA
jgi:hypothetical protein